MVSKNNLQHKLEADAKRVPHYSIRRLSVGVCSVLLGTTLYFGAGNVAHADTLSTDSVNNEQVAKTVNQTNINNKNNTDVNASEQNNTETLVNTQNNNTNSENNNQTKTINYNQSAVQQSSQQNTNADITVPSDQDYNANKDSINHDAPAETASLSDNSSITINHNQLDSNHKSAILTFKSSNFKAGDTYTIKIPKNFWINTDRGNVANLQPAFGSTKYSEDSKYYIITDKFINSGTINQSIELHYSPIHWGGYNDTTLKTIRNNNGLPYSKLINSIKLIKNDSETTSLNVNVMTPKLSIGWGSNFTPDKDIQFIRNKHDVNINGTLDNILTDDQGLSLGRNDNALNHYITGDLDHLDVSFSIPKMWFHPKSVTITSTTDPNEIPFNKRHKQFHAGQIVKTPELLSIDSNTGNTTFKITLNRDDILSIADTSEHSIDGTFKANILGQYEVPDNKFDIMGTYNLNDNLSGTVTTTGVTTSGIETNTTNNWIINPRLINSNFDLSIGLLTSSKTSYMAADPEKPDTMIPSNTVAVTKQNKNENDISDEIIGNIKNVTDTDINNAVYKINIPDGINTTRYLIATGEFANSIKNSGPNIAIIEYKDGTTDTISLTDTSHDYKNKSGNKEIKSITIKLAKFMGGDSIYARAYGDDAHKSFPLDKTYTDGTLLKNGDLLTTKASFTGDNIVPMNDMVINCIRLVHYEPEEKYGLWHNIVGEQSSKTPGAHAGGLRYQASNSAYGNPHLTNPIFYITIPNNVILTSDISNMKIGVGLNGSSGIVVPKSTKIMTIDGHKVLKIDLSNYNDIPYGVDFTLLFDNMIDGQTSTDTSYFLIMSKNFNGPKYQAHNINVNDPNQKILLDIINSSDETNLNFYNQVSGNWSILASSGMTSATMTKGNTNAGPIVNGIQDDHGTTPNEFNIYGSIINATEVNIPNAVQIINLPGTSYDNKSEFVPVMSGPAKVINAANGKDLSDIGDLMYGEEPVNYNYGSDTIYSTNWKRANEVTDWSKIKSVALRFGKNKLPQSTSVRVIVPMLDNKIYDHVGKSIYVSSIIFSYNGTPVVPVSRDDINNINPGINMPSNTINNGLPTLAIKPGSAASAKLTVTGKATVKTAIHYSDENGQEHYIELPDKTKTYNELSDTMKRSDFISKNSDLTAADKALLPNNLTIDFDSPSIKNSNETYINNYQNGTAEFNKQVKYDFDKDTIVFEAALLEPITQSVHHTRTIHYVYNNGSKAADDFVQTSKDFVQIGFKNTKTGEITWNKSSDIYKFNSVTSPKIKGYTPDKLSVNEETINANSEDSVITVTYSPDNQKATVKYIDDTTGTQLKNDNLAGHSDQNSNYSTAKSIKDYQNQGYELISDSTNGQTITFDHDDNIDQSYEVHLKHKTSPITDAVSKDLIVHYQYQDNSKAANDKTALSLTFTRDGYYDKVTNENHWNNWTPAQSFETIQSPQIAGYTPSQTEIANISADANSPKVTEKTVIYSPDQQKLTIDFIDDVTGKTLKTITKDGPSNGNVDYTTKNDITDYEAVNYKLVSDSTNGQKLTFDTNDNVDQHYEIHLTHAYSLINDEHDVTETIKYQYNNGKQAANNNVQTIKFTRDGQHDLVTNEDQWNNWTPENHQFNTVTSPVIQGYTPDIQSVSAKTVLPINSNITKTVTYSPDEQKMTITYIDDTTGKTLETKSLTGVSDADANYNTKSSINNYVAKHYKLVSDSTDGQELVFDNDDKINQNYEVHLVHTYNPIHDSHNVTETIHYIYEDGSKAQDNHVAKVSFTRDGRQDLVINENQWNNWNKDQSFDAVNTPVINGYTPDIINIKAITVSHDSDNIDKTITYHADNQKIIVNYIDQDTGKTLQIKNLTGKTSTDSHYLTKDTIADYEGQHYILVSDDTNSQSLQFDNDSSKDQTYNVYLKHAHQATTDYAEVNETIHYIYEDGSKAANDYKANTIKFDRTGDIDLVTNQTKWNDWTTNNKVFAQVDSPVISGYTPSQSSINAIEVKPGDKDIDQTVTYVPDKQSMVINYIDETTGKIIKTDTRTGTSNQHSNYSTAKTINDYESQYYNLVKDETSGHTLVFDHDDKTTQTYNVYLVHQTQSVKRTSTVNETIDYKFDNGSQAAKTYQATPLTFTQTGIKDLVTGQTDWNGQWTSEQSFNAVVSPSIVGYTPSQERVNAQLVSHDSKDIHKVITYTANNQLAKLNFVDKTNNKLLKSLATNGKFNETIIFSELSNTLKQFENQGYVLVSNNFNNQTFQVDNSKNIFTIVLTHGTQQVTNNKTIKRTINFIDKSTGKALRDFEIQTVTFVQHGTKDMVTGKIIWDSVDSQVFNQVSVPQINGYTAEQSIVNKQNVSINDNNLVVNVLYTKNAVSTTSVSTNKTSTISVETVKPTQITNKQLVIQNQNTPTQNNNKLPQTGNEQTNGLSQIGTLIAGTASALFAGMLLTKKRKRNEK